MGTDINKGDGEYCVTGNDNNNFAKYLLNSSNWSKYAEGFNGAIATGGPTVEQFWSSFNKKYNTNYSNDINLSTHIGYSDTLYFQHEEPWNDCYGYWLASTTDNNNAVWRVHWKGTVEYAGCNVTYYRNSSINMLTL